MHSVIVNEEDVIKYFKSRKQLEKEILFLSKLRNFLPVPSILYINMESNVLKMERVNGKCFPGMQSEYLQELFHQLGGYLLTLHTLRKSNYFGKLESDGKLFSLPLTSSEDFYLAQFEKWFERFDSLHEYNYIVTYLSDIWMCRRRNLEDLLLKKQSIFSHGDLIPQNILVDGSKIVAFLDWEHAGFYPLEWELRKIYPFFIFHEYGMKLKQAFISGYGNTFNDSIKPSSIAFLIAMDSLGWLYWLQRTESNVPVDQVVNLLHRSLSVLQEKDNAS